MMSMYLCSIWNQYDSQSKGQHSREDVVRSPVYSWSEEFGRGWMDLEGRRFIVRKSWRKKRICPSVLSLYQLLGFLKGLLVWHPCIDAGSGGWGRALCYSWRTSHQDRHLWGDIPWVRYKAPTTARMETFFSWPLFQNHYCQAPVATSLNLPHLNISLLPVFSPSPQFNSQEDGFQITKHNHFLWIYIPLPHTHFIT